MDSKSWLTRGISSLTESAATCIGEEGDVGIPLIEEVRDNLGSKEDSAHLVVGADIMYETVLVTGDLIDDLFCHCRFLSFE